jgi:hypothetical protein
VQRALLCAASEYFRSALLGSFAEAEDKTLRLPGCDTTVFELMLYWLCMRGLPDISDQLLLLSDEDKDRDNTEETIGKAQASLVRLWHIAGMYLMPALQNFVMVCFLDMLGSHQIELLAMETAFEMGSAECILRKMLLGEFVDEHVRSAPIGRRSRGLHGRARERLTAFGTIPDFLASFADEVTKDDGKVYRACAEYDDDEEYIREWGGPNT